jgi:hypothetical protein
VSSRRERGSWHFHQAQQETLPAREVTWKNAYELHLMQNDATCILDYFGVIYIIILCELYVRGFFLKPVPRRIQPRNEKPGLMRRISYHSIEFRTVSSSLVLGYE